MHKVIMPKLGMAQSWCLVEKFHIKEGDEVKKGDVILEVSTDKVSYEIEAKENGYILKILKKENEEVPVGEIIAFIGEKNELGSIVDHPENIKEKTSKNNISSEDNKKIMSKGDLSKIKISVLAKKLAEKNDLDISKIEGTGKEGRISKEDVESHLEKQKTAIDPVSEMHARDIKIHSSEPLSSIRRTISEKMTYSKQNIPHISQTTKADITELSNLKGKLAEKIENLSFTDFFIKATALALRENLELNSFLSDDKHIVFEDINIGLVTAIPGGIIIPVIKNCDRKPIIEIIKERKKLIKKAQDNKLDLEDISGGTFTISNLGMYKIRSFTAIIHPDQSSILAIGSIYMNPEFINNSIQARKVIELTLSEDHRIIDGATGAKFLMKIIELIENPDLLKIDAE